MTAIKIDNLLGKILVVGPAYDQTDKILHAEKLIPNYDLIIMNGDLGSLGGDFDLIRNHISILNRMIDTGKVIYNTGARDIQLINGLLTDAPHDIVEWISLRPTAVIASFTNGNTLIVVNGGITSKMKMPDLIHDTEVAFVKNIDVKKHWHHNYNGRFGYVISNEPLTLAPPKFYSYSAQIGNDPFNPETKVYGQEADQFGLKDTIIL